MASQAVFDTPELLEAILLDINMRTLLFLPRVSKQWRATIAGSSALQIKLFFKQASDVTGTSKRPSCNRRDLFLPDPHVENYATSTMVNHLLAETVFVGPGIARDCFTLDPFTLPSTASAHRMFLYEQSRVSLDLSRMYYMREELPTWYDKEEGFHKWKFMRTDWTVGTFVRRNLVLSGPDECFDRIFD